MEGMGVCGGGIIVVLVFCGGGDGMAIYEEGEG